MTQCTSCLSARRKEVVRHAQAKFDFVYCAGLFDYLSDKVCARLLQYFAARTNVGGTVLVTNVHSSNPQKISMEHLLEWHLIYRDEGQLESLLPTPRADTRSVQMTRRAPMSLSISRYRRRPEAVNHPTVQTRSVSLYQQEFNDFRLAYSKAGALACAILILAGLGLDYTLYPQYFEKLAPVRVLATACVLAIYLVLLRALRSRCDGSTPLTLLWLSVPQVMISWMIWATEGTDSIYFVGLHLALYATGILLPISFFENITFGIFTYALVFSCLLFPSRWSDGSRQIHRAIPFFSSFRQVLSSFCTYFNERARATLFCAGQVPKKSDLASKPTPLSPKSRAT